MLFHTCDAMLFLPYLLAVCDFFFSMNDDEVKKGKVGKVWNCNNCTKQSVEEGR